MKKTLGGLLTAFIVVALGIYMLEHYILKGKLLTESAIRPSDINPHPTLALQVPEGDATVTAFLRSDMDMDYQVIVTGPADEPILNEAITANRTHISFDAPTPGTYRVTVTLEDPPGRAVWVRAFLNDNRIVYPIYAKFF